MKRKGNEDRDSYNAKKAKEVVAKKKEEAEKMKDPIYRHNKRFGNKAINSFKNGFANFQKGGL